MNRQWLFAINSNCYIVRIIISGIGYLHCEMSTKPPFLRIHVRAIAQATEVQERVGQAFIFASGTEEIELERTKGHFGNEIIIFKVELTKASAMNKFLKQLKEAGILSQIKEQIEQRLDEECTLYFRLDKQKAYEEELALAENTDVIAVMMKIAAYPARRELALNVFLDWFKNF